MATQTGSIDLTASNSVKLAAEAGWQSDLEDYATKAELDVQADRIGMVVANNDASSSLQLTADAMTYIGNNVTIKGTDGTGTVISGGQIQAGSLSIGAFDSAAQSATLNSNISVGGRNLASSLAANWRRTTVSESSRVGTAWEYMSRTASTTRISAIDLIPVDGDFVTVSLASGYDAFLTFFDANGYMKKYITWSNQRTVDLSNYNGVTAIGLTVRKSDNSTITLDGVALAKIKLERGNKATDWTPAPEDVDAAISNAAKTATSYVTEITGQNGIMVHPSTDQTTGVRVTSDVDILRGGTSVINIGTNDAVRVGSASGGHIAIDSDSMDFWASAAQLAMRFTGQKADYPSGISTYFAQIEDGVTRENEVYNDNSYISLYTREEPTYEGSDEKVVTESMATMHAYTRGAEGTAEISVFMHQDPDANTASRGAIIASDKLTCEGTTNVGDPYGSVDGLTIGSPTRVTSSESCTALTNDTMGPDVALTAGKWLIMGNWGFTNTSSSAKRLTIGLYRNATGSSYTWRVHTTASSSTAHKLEVVDTIVLTSNEVITLYASSSPASTSASTQWITAVRLS